MAVEHDPFVDGFPTGIYNLHVQGIAQLASFDYQKVIPWITIESPSIIALNHHEITIKSPLIPLIHQNSSPLLAIINHRHSSKAIPNMLRRLRGSWGYPQIIQSWGSNCTLKLETTMVTTRDPNDKFTKPPWIFPWYSYIHPYFMEILMNSPQIFHNSYGIPMNSPQIFQPLQIHGLLVQRLHGCAHVVA